MDARLKAPPPGSYDWLLKEAAPRDDAPPPPPPERPQGGPRIRVEIIIEDRAAAARAARRGDSRAGWVIALLVLGAWALLAGCAHAETWTSYEQNGTTFLQGPGVTGRSYRQGFTTYSEIEEAGQTRHCRSWQQGWQTVTECH